MVVETRYVTSGEVFVACQISGQTAPDLLMTPGFVSHLEQSWENPNGARFFNGLGAFSRLIRFDKRGTGLSDRGVGIPHLDERIDDIRAVLDAAGSKKAYLLGISEGGPMSILFAATYPDRVAGLILFGTYARTVGASAPWTTWRRPSAKFGQDWGTGKGLRNFSPAAARDPAAVQAFAKFERLSASPSDVINLLRMNREIDVRAILPTIHVPTRRHPSPATTCALRSWAGRELAENIPGARYVELPGERSRSLVVGRRIGSSRRSASSWGFRLLSSRLIASSPLCCSPISSIRRYERRRWVTGSGVQLWKRITRRCAQNCSGIAVAK